jgi:thiamine-phosphate pyrophosphorylase
MPLSHAARLELFRSADLYAVVTRKFCANRDPLDVLGSLVDSGVRIVQMREKDLADRELYELALEFRRICVPGKVLLMVNDRLDIALASGADGVHLGQDDLPCADARRLAPELLVGVSTHNPAEICEAVRNGASCVNIGPIFPTLTKEKTAAPVGLENLKAWSGSVAVPFSVMGGLKEANIADVKKSGGTIFAMVTELTQAPDIPARVASLRKRLEQ